MYSFDILEKYINKSKNFEPRRGLGLIRPLLVPSFVKKTYFPHKTIISIAKIFTRVFAFDTISGNMF